MTPRLYVPPAEARETDPTWPGGAWGRGGGTIPMFVSADAAAWLLTADDDHGTYQLMRVLASDPARTRPRLERCHVFFPDREQAEAVRKELLHTGLIGEAGYHGHYRTDTGRIVADRLRPAPAYLVTA